MKIIYFLVLSLVAASASAEPRKLKTVGEYCSIVQARIVNLAEAEVEANTEMGKYASDQPTANSKNFKVAREKLGAFSASLKENEEEWARLGCIHIYPK